MLLLRRTDTYACQTNPTRLESDTCREGNMVAPCNCAPGRQESIRRCSNSSRYSSLLSPVSHRQVPTIVFAGPSPISHPISHLISPSPDAGTLHNGAEYIRQLGQGNPRKLIALHARDVAVANPIFHQNDLIPFLHGLTGSSRYTDVSHVACQDNLLDAPRLQRLVQRRLFKGAGELLPDELLAILRRRKAVSYRHVCFFPTKTPGENK
jgi:hypothetical protein